MELDVKLYIHVLESQERIHRILSFLKDQKFMLVGCAYFKGASHSLLQLSYFRTSVFPRRARGTDL